MESGDVTLKSPLTDAFLRLPTGHSSVSSYVLAKSQQIASQQDRMCIADPTTGDETFYSDLERISRRVGAFLQNNGFQSLGDVVVNLSHNGAKLHAFFLGVWRAGGVVQTVYPEEDVDTIVERIQATGRAKFLLYDEHIAPKCIKVLESPQCNGVRGIVFGNREASALCHSAEYILTTKGAERFQDVQVAGTDTTALLLPTSGTTGGSKYVVYTHEMLLRNIVLFEKFPFTDTSQSASLTLITGKQTHFTGAVCPLAMITAGRPLLMMAQVTQENILKAVDKYKVTSIFSFPSFLTGLVEHPAADKYDLGSLERVFTAGMVVGKAFVGTVSKLPSVRYITSIYGMTEAGFLTSNVNWTAKGYEIVAELDSTRNPTCGQLPPGAELRVRNIETGEPVGPGEMGELCLKNAFVCSRYLNNPEASARTFHEGWVNTGDLGFYDSEGNVHVVNRVKEVFKYFNNHITPSEIEELLLAHPAVKQACVVGIDDVQGGGGSVPRAFVTLKGSAGETEAMAAADRILRDVNERLPSYKKLRGGLFVLEKLPHGKSGKVLRQALATYNPIG